MFAISKLQFKYILWRWSILYPFSFPDRIVIFIHAFIDVAMEQKFLSKNFW